MALLNTERNLAALKSSAFFPPDVIFLYVCFLNHKTEFNLRLYCLRLQLQIGGMGTVYLTVRLCHATISSSNKHNASVSIAWLSWGKRTSD